MKLEDLLEILRILNGMDFHPETDVKREEVTNLVLKLIKEKIS